MPTEPDIVLLRELAEELARLEASVPGLGRGGPAGPPEPLASLWPAIDWSRPGLTPEDCTQALEDLRQRRDALAADLAARRQALAAARRQAEQRRAGLRAPTAALEERIAGLGSDAQRLEKASAQARDRAEAQGLRSRELSAWLFGVTPLAISGYQDARGHKVDAARLLQATQELKEARAGHARLRSRATELAAAADQARKRQARLQLELMAAREKAARLAQDLSSVDERLDRAAQGLEERQAGLEALSRDQEAARRAGELLAQLTLEAARQVGACLDGPDPGPPALASLEGQLDQSRDQGRRCQRLAGILARLEALATGRAARVGAALGAAREANREIDGLESRLPELIAPLTSPETATPQERTAAAAGLSLLAARVEAAAPQALAAGQALEELRRALEQDHARGKALTEAWRQAGRAQRAALETAQALISELPLAAGELDRRREELLAQAGQVAETLAPLAPPAALAPLAEVAGREKEYARLAADLMAQAGELTSRLPAVAAPKLSKTPISLKPLSAALRRLGGRQVDDQRLIALAGAVEQWRALLRRPVEEAIARPSRQVAENLSHSLGRLAADRARLAAARGRTARLLAGLRREHHAERDQGRAALAQLVDLTARHQEATRRLTSRERELTGLQREYRREQEQGAQARSRLIDLTARHQETAQRLAFREAELSGLRHDYERERDLGVRARRRLASLTARHQEATQRLAAQEQELTGLKREYRREQEQGAQARSRLIDLTTRHQEATQRLASREAELSGLREDHARERDQGAQALRDLEELATRHQEASRRLAAREAELGGLRADHERERTRGAQARAQLQDLTRRHQDARRLIREQESELVQTRADQALAKELAARLEQSEARLAASQASLAHSRRAASALKAKSLERHGLLTQARATLAQMEGWRREAERTHGELERTRQELERACAELGESRRMLREASSQHDQAQEALAAERHARAREALDLIQGQSLNLELAATKTEATRWAELAGQLSAALAVTGQEHQKETAGLREEIDRLAAEAASLREQLDRISRLITLAEPEGPRPQAPALPRPPADVPVLTQEQVDESLSRLASIRRRLAEMGRGAAGHWLSMVALTTGLVLVAPSTPSTATRADTPLIAPRPVTRQLTASLSPGPLLNLPASARRLPSPLGRGKVELSLVPLKPTSAPLPEEVNRLVAQAAREAGLSEKVLMTSARAVFAGRAAVEPRELEELAATARVLAHRHPAMFQELAQRGLPASAGQLAAVPGVTAEAQGRFMDRLYREYRNLGFNPEEALGACAANEHAARSLARSWRKPLLYLGRVRPVGAMEAMTLDEFLKKATPYIQAKLKVFLRQRDMTFEGDLDQYVEGLAFDMYCAAKRFQVPVSVMMAVAHQESWYANVLGDQDLSASPYQIYQPTRVLICSSLARQGFVPPPQDIKLERHLTMATYMAAFHLRELMAEAYSPAKRHHPPTVDMERVMKRYNGSGAYAGLVAQRRATLVKFLAQR